jgi:hypothetical protein
MIRSPPQELPVSQTRHFLIGAWSSTQPRHAERISNRRFQLFTACCTEPVNSSMIFGLLPTAVMRVGFSMSVGMV